MIQPDVIVCWPRNCDYPMWRAWLADYRIWLRRVLVVFTDHDGADLSAFVRSVMPDVTYLESHTDGDWRDAAVNLALDNTNGEWVWFTEQDFLIHRPGPFWSVVDSAAVRYESIGLHEAGGRVHPCCLFTTRAAVERTSRYFGTPPIDHFWQFGQELEADRPMFDLEIDGKLIAGKDFEHLAGTSQNHSLIDRGEDEGVYKRDRFRRYLWECLNVGVPLEPGWEAAARKEIA